MSGGRRFGIAEKAFLYVESFCNRVGKVFSGQVQYIAHVMRILFKCKKGSGSSNVGFKKILCLIILVTLPLELNDYCKTQLRGSRWRRQVANYSLAMTQLQSILERFAAQDLRSFLFQKSLRGIKSFPVTLLSFSYCPTVLHTRIYSYRYRVSVHMYIRPFYVLQYGYLRSITVLTVPDMPSSSTVPCPQNQST